MEVRQKTRVEMSPIEALPRPVDITTTAMGQWAGGPSKDRRRVLVDEGPVEGRRKMRPETVTATPVARSADAGKEEGPRSAEEVEQGTPMFYDMVEPTVEIVM